MSWSHIIKKRLTQRFMQYLTGKSYFLNSLTNTITFYDERLYYDYCAKIRNKKKLGLIRFSK